MPKISEEMKSWNLVHVDLVGPYVKSVRQKKTGGNIIHKELILTCMTMLDPATGYIETPQYHYLILMMSQPEINHTYTNNIPGWSNCLTKHGYEDTNVYAKLCLTADMNLKKHC